MKLVAEAIIPNTTEWFDTVTNEYDDLVKRALRPMKSSKASPEELQRQKDIAKLRAAVAKKIEEEMVLYDRSSTESNESSDETSIKILEYHSDDESTSESVISLSSETDQFVDTRGTTATEYSSLQQNRKCRKSRYT